MRKTKLVLADLYKRDGAYAHAKSSGVSWAAVGSTLFGCVLAWIGLVVRPLRPLFDYAWFAGAIGAGGLYFLLTRTAVRA